MFPVALIAALSSFLLLLSLAIVVISILVAWKIFNRNNGSEGNNRHNSNVQLTGQSNCSVSNT